MWRVDDIATAVAAARAHGGDASEPARQPYGLISECADDQGSRFYLGQL
jgi:predicted enzyme related to lactoylglutathione lyase